MKILYLEDDQALARVTTRGLVRCGYDVEHHAEIASFRTALPNSNAHRILLDLKIGNDTSLQLISEISAVTRAPIVILSGYGTIRTAVQAMKLGAIDFLTKPCSLEDILAAFNTPEEPPNNEEPADIQRPSLKAQEHEAIQKALDDNGGNISAAARQLKMHRRTLQRKLKKRHTID